MAHEHQGRSSLAPSRSRRPWFLVGALSVAVVGLLVASGILSPTLALYGGLIATCGLMHLLGHARRGSGRGH